MVLTTARRPAILVELGYSTNPAGRPLPHRPEQPAAMASAIADAIVEYLLEYERKTGLAPTREAAGERPAAPRDRAGLGLLLLGGCVYYNGMYNTKRLASSARKRRARRAARSRPRTTGARSSPGRNAGGPASRTASTWTRPLMLKGTALVPPRPVHQRDGAARPGHPGPGLERRGRGRVSRARPAATSSWAIRPRPSSPSPGRCRAADQYRRAAGAPGARPGAPTHRPQRPRRWSRSTACPATARADERLLALAAAGQRRRGACGWPIRCSLSRTAAASGTAWSSTVGRAATRSTASHIVDRLLERPGTRAGEPDALADRGCRSGSRAPTPRVPPLAWSRRRERAVTDRGRTLGPGAAHPERICAGARTVDDLAQPIELLDSLAGGTASEAAGPSAKPCQLRVDAGPDPRRERLQRGAGSPHGGPAPLPRRGARARYAGAPRVLAASLFRRVADDWPDSPYAPKALLAVGDA